MRDPKVSMNCAQIVHSFFEGGGGFRFLFDPPTEAGVFGAVAPYRCDNCGPMWDRPIGVITYHQTYWQPEEGYDMCPSCENGECIGPNQEGASPCKVMRRYCITKHGRAA